LEAARVGQAKAAATARNAVASRGKCEAVIAGPLAALEAGALADSAGAKAHAAELVGLGKELSFDQSLLISLPMALVKKPEERGSFDAMIVQSYVAELHKALASFAECLLGLEATQAERAQEEQTAEALLAAAREELEKTGSAVATAEAEAAELAEQETIAKRALKDLGPKLKKAQAARSRDDGELHAFLTTYMSTYESLRDRKAEGETAAVAA